VFRYIDIGSIDNKALRIAEPKTFSGKEAPSRARRVVREGDVLFSTVRPYLRNIALAGAAHSGCLTSTGISVLRPKPSVLPGYLFRLVSSPAFVEQVGRSMDGTLYPAVRDSDVLGASIPLPPLAEQRRIVERIEALFARIRQARADLLRIAPLARLFRARVVAAAVSGADGDNWEQQTVADIADVVTGTTPPTNQRGHYGGQTPFVKPTDLDAGYFVETARETLTESGVAVSRPVPAGSTLLTCIGATIGKAGFARVGCTTNQQINALVPKPGCVEPRWLYRLVTSEAFQQQILANASATTLPIINKGRLKRLEIRVPPIAEQQKLADRVDALCPFSEAAEREATRALALLDHLERSILTRAFRGELVPQDPADEPASVSLARSQEGAPAAPRRGRPRRAA
jgi:type I restriction enzyme S subunit